MYTGGASPAAASPAVTAGRFSPRVGGTGHALVLTAPGWRSSGPPGVAHHGHGLAPADQRHVELAGGDPRRRIA